jgi:mRNA-degrading endonuclease RelE of RelBE toxin-antitoxin system
MQLERTKRFEKAYRKLSHQNQGRVDDAIMRFMSNPLYPSLHTEKVSGAHSKWSFRASDSLRCTFEFEGDLQELRVAEIVSLSNVDNHDTVYRQRRS